MWSISRKCDIFVPITCLWPVDDIYQRFVMEPICRTQSVVEPRFSFRQNDFSREMGGFRRDSLLMISATFSDHLHHRMKIAAPIVRQFYEENSAIETTIMHKSLRTLLHIWGIFQFRENCKKISKKTHCFMREPKSDRKIWMLHYCPKNVWPWL